MSSDPKSNISQAEIEVMKIIWKMEPVSVRDVCDAVNAERGEPLCRTTILKHMQRLEGKNWLVRDDRRPARYRATVSAPRAFKRLLTMFKEVVFDGSTMSMVRCLIGDGELSESELGELRSLIDGAKPEKD